MPTACRGDDEPLIPPNQRMVVAMCRPGAVRDSPTKIISIAIGDLLDLVGPAIRAGATLTRLDVDVPAESVRDHDLIAGRRERLANRFLVGPGTVGLRGVTKPFSCAPWMTRINSAQSGPSP